MRERSLTEFFSHVVSSLRNSQDETRFSLVQARSLYELDEADGVPEFGESEFAFAPARSGLHFAAAERPIA